MYLDPNYLLPKLDLGLSPILSQIFVEACDTVDEMAQLRLVCKSWKTFIEEEILSKEEYQEMISKQKLIHAWKEGRSSAMKLPSAMNAGIGDAVSANFFVRKDLLFHILKTPAGLVIVVYHQQKYVCKVCIPKRFGFVEDLLVKEQKLFAQLHDQHQETREIRAYQLNFSTRIGNEIFEMRREFSDNDFSCVRLKPSLDSEVMLITLQGVHMKLHDLDGRGDVLSLELPYEYPSDTLLYDFDGQERMVLFTERQEGSPKHMTLINLANFSIVTNEDLTVFDNGDCISGLFHDKYLTFYNSLEPSPVVALFNSVRILALSIHFMSVSQSVLP